jgi:glucose-1-phosphate adenylyltransferase
MGVYVFDTRTLVRELIEDFKRDGNRDFGHDIIPQMIRKGEKVFGYEFVDENRKESKYWRDVGDIDSLYDANMDLLQVSPELNLYDSDWPIHAYRMQGPPAKTINESAERRGLATNSITGTGAIISGAQVDRSILAPMVRVLGESTVTESILMPGVQVGRGCRIHRTIIDEGVTVPDGTVIGADPEDDAGRFQISPGGVAAVPSGYLFKR